MYQNQGAGVQLQRPLDHFSRVDRDVVDGPFGLLFIGDQDVLAVKEQDAELLGFAVGHGGVAIIDQSVPG